jgi:hypothetical protein
MSIDKLRDLAMKLQSHENTVTKDADRPEEIRLIVPLLIEAVHEFANLETMVGALERRLQRLESARSA